ncbi:MAG: DNA topoisomerase VI subunit B [Candidatus Altiarchaeota archaeon]|nr:DNA topoisomerase VI subunit B [Candidatus Altiarchaeota archaeon]
MPKEADDLFKELREHSIAEFFRKNAQMLGYSGKIKSLTTVVHELVTNSLDACEESHIPPDILVKIEQIDEEAVVVHGRDNGPGIPKKHISDVFGKMLAGTKFHRNIQLRGQQGIGVAGVTMFSQMTTGKPVEIITSTKNEAWDIELTIDIKKNRADIVNQQSISPPPETTGTEFIARFKDVQFSTGDQGPYEYLRRTAIANPHTEITYVDPSGAKIVFNRSTEEIPKPPKEIPPHPKGVIVDDIVLMSKVSKSHTTKGMLQTEFSRMSSQKAAEVQQHVTFDLNLSPKKLGWGEAEQIIKAFKKMTFLAPATDCLRQIGEVKIETAMRNILAPEFLAIVERKPTVYGGGYPFQIEVGVAYGGHAGRKLATGEKRYEIMRFANRAPLLFDAGGCALTKAVQTVDWKRYGLKDLENLPVTIFVSLISTHIPYISAGKQSVADIEEIVDEIRFALMDVGRKFNRFHSKRRRAEEHMLRRDKLLKYVTEIAPAIAEITGKKKDEVLKKWEKLVEDNVSIAVEEEPGEPEEEEPSDVAEAAEEEGEGNGDTKISDYM